ncbi:MAG TPA: hypothetical protein PKG54_11400 [Phycisphaerae bacterium]|jgi:hypothetical protein|nr:hypothetical protein [Phycisphaerae bacterium]HOB75119.1 hypothetical protein [Phycisphaerae bacterium]HOJ54659.1 hypothetical protein [Phycisphaerae bacterium]HOL27285.1 hypothetical protein [Phycisphaerae bacterium]HPP21086.1 hypothetical protein [Phycisphaerae bacterium]
MDDMDLVSNLGAVLGLLLMLAATLLMLLVMPPVEAWIRIRDRWRGKRLTKSTERPELEMEE